eukprot:880605-Amphidinium_carterae.1
MEVHGQCQTYILPKPDLSKRVKLKAVCPAKMHELVLITTWPFSTLLSLRPAESLWLLPTDKLHELVLNKTWLEEELNNNKGHATSPFCTRPCI